MILAIVPLVCKGNNLALVVNSLKKCTLKNNIGHLGVCPIRKIWNATIMITWPSMQSHFGLIPPRPGKTTSRETTRVGSLALVQTRSCYNCDDKRHFIAECHYENRELHNGRAHSQGQEQKSKGKYSKAPNKKFYNNKTKKGKRPPRVVLVTREEYSSDEVESSSDDEGESSKEVAAIVTTNIPSSSLFESPNENPHIKNAHCFMATSSLDTSIVLSTQEEYSSGDDDVDDEEDATSNGLVALASLSTNSSSPSESPNEIIHVEEESCLMAKSSKVSSPSPSMPNISSDLGVDDASLKVKQEMLEFDEFMFNLQGLCSGVSKWVLDSGCTSHMTGGKNLVKELRPNINNITVSFGDNSTSELMMHQPKNKKKTLPLMNKIKDKINQEFKINHSICTSPNIVQDQAHEDEHSQEIEEAQIEGQDGDPNDQFDQVTPPRPKRTKEEIEAHRLARRDRTLEIRGHTHDKVLGDVRAKVSTRRQLANFSNHHAYIFVVEPKKVFEALEDSDWVEAMHEELNNFKRNKVWTLVEKPKECRNVIGTKWIFKNKQDEFGNIVRNKARLVAQGFSQVEGIDFGRPMLPWLVLSPSLMTDRFEMSMMGEMKFFLGFEIKQLREGTFINQAKYLQDMLKRFKMTELKGVATPMVTKCHLALDPNGKEVDQKGRIIRPPAGGLSGGRIIRPGDIGYQAWSFIAAAFLLQSIMSRFVPTYSMFLSGASRGGRRRSRHDRSSDEFASNAPRKSVTSRRKNKEVRENYKAMDSVSYSAIRLKNWYEDVPRDEEIEGRRYWCIEQEFIYNEPMKNLRPMQAINVDILAINDHFEDAIWVAGRMGLLEIMKIQCDYSPDLVKQFFVTLAIRKDEEHTMEWMTGSTHCSATLRQFAGFLGVPVDGGRRLHGPQQTDKNALVHLYTSAGKVGNTKGLLPIYSQLLRFFRATICPSGGNNDALRGALVDLMHLSYKCAHDVTEERDYTLDVMNFIFHEIHDAMVSRTTIPYAPYIQLLINNSVAVCDEDLSGGFAPARHPDVPAMRKQVSRLSWFQRHILCMNIEIHKENYATKRERYEIKHTRRLFFHKLGGDTTASASFHGVTVDGTLAEFHGCDLDDCLQRSNTSRRSPDDTDEEEEEAAYESMMMMPPSDSMDEVASLSPFGVSMKGEVFY
ncbi:hypothetical protein QYE76_002477 [Lolium multiflorum]|uniref:Reverse transcriptase Ty1/copia-type domain-containing protein n=1 Tax=Lolium multiflorum TaxID=4521 RepID=A0AAD8RP05_LOLMU|nr:hypothetical protein QYE76_002477 [Lolium multiflorum]